MKTVYQSILAVIKAILMLLNAIIIPLMVLPCAILRLIPIAPLHHAMTWMIYEILIPIWIDVFTFLLKLGSHTQWHVNINGELRHGGWYFLMSNHRSWIDVLVMMSVVNRKIPMPKFFMKQELLWTLPVIGVICWLLDFPFMKRHTKAYIKKHPEQRYQDIETTRKKCEIFKTQPVTVVNYVEGTRFTPEKHQRQRSSFRYLLSPKAGGMAFTLVALEDVLHQIIDVTVYYLPEQQTLWDILCGKVDDIFIDLEVLPIPETLRGDYYKDIEFKKQFQRWLNQRWKHKDEKIHRMIKERTS